MVAFDFCGLGMTSTDANGITRPAKKRTRVLTNSGHIAAALRRYQWSGGHTHTTLEGGRAKPCEKYPQQFTELIVRGLQRELEDKNFAKAAFDKLDISSQMPALMSIIEELERKQLAVPEHEADEVSMNQLHGDCEFVDDISGKSLNRAEVIQARLLEMRFFKRLNVYTKVPREPWTKTITTKWLDVNKGDAQNPNIRSRLVGRELNLSKRDDLFAGTPPLESLRYIVSRCASTRGNLIMAIDVKRAYFYAPATRDLYIEIPADDRQPGDEHMLAKLNLSLYGTRDAAPNWVKAYTDVLTSHGFTVGKHSAQNFWNLVRKIVVSVHGDDF